jgi:LssY C-terminus
MSDATDAYTSPPARRYRRLIGLAAAVLLLWAVVAYLVMPAWWKRYIHRHPALDGVPGITQTANGIPGDPINVALVGTKEDLVRAMIAAKWYPADPLSLKSSLQIAVDAVFKRPDPDAPVSNLYLFGRKEDIAFQQDVDNNPRRRHHVRFWRTETMDSDGRPIWVGSAVFDERVGLSRTTGQITHVTAPDVDAERDFLFRCLEQVGVLSETFVVTGFHKVRSGKNGGGDPWTTDGDLWAGVIAAK